MPRVTTAYVKNIVRRAFAEIVDPEPDQGERARLWQYFQSRCAYCGRPIRQGDREGRVDHLVAASERGGNHLGNRVLACGPCNDDEKRDRPWKQFLREKSPDHRTYEQRRRKIEEWVTQHEEPASARLLSDAAARAAAEVNKVFDAHVAELRALKRSRTCGLE